MQYHDGSTANLGDIVTIPMPEARAKARIIMLGDTGEHLEMDEDFLEWVKQEKLLEPSMVIVQWVETNPLAHDDPNFAPVGEQNVHGIGLLYYTSQDIILFCQCKRLNVQKCPVVIGANKIFYNVHEISISARHARYSARTNRRLALCRRNFSRPVRAQ